MSNTAAVNEAFDAIVSTITPEETSVSDPQSKSTALTALIETSGVAAESAESLGGALSGYEATFVSMVDRFAVARKAGNTEADIRKALQADQKQSGTKHFGASNDSCSALDLLASFHGIEGDLPQGWVYRPAANAATGLLEGEQSVTALVRAVRAPAKKAEIRDAGHGSLYGKAVVESILKDAVSKEAAITALQAQVRLLDKVVRDAKAAERGPKTAQTYLKAASGPVGKVAEALDAGLVGDADEVKALITALEVALAAAKAHAALV